MNTTETDVTVASAWEADAREHVLQSKLKSQAADKLYIVADFEYRWDREAHRLYQSIEGGAGENDIRWPFHQIICASWLLMRFKALDDAPIVESFTTASLPTCSEADIVKMFFDVLASNPGAVLASWGGEAKDFAALRRAAQAHDLRLPPQLRDGNPFSTQRIDLANSTSCQTQNVHLPEYSTALGIPSKLVMPSRSVGLAVEAEDWDLVREVCTQDVATAALITGRYLATHAAVSPTGTACDLAIASGVIAQRPESDFVQKYLVPWLRAREQ